MSETEPASVPLLFPDPVIEYYLSKVDRAAIREQLKKTPSERLQGLENEAQRKRKDPALVLREEPEPPPPKKAKIDMGSDPGWFTEAASVPLLFPDPVIEAYLEDVDRGLIREALKLSVSERFARFERLMRRAYELRRAGAPSESSARDTA